MQKLQILKHEFLTESVLKDLSHSRIVTLLDFLEEDTERLSVISKLNISQVLAVKNNIFRSYSAPLINGTTLLKNSLTKKKNLETGLTTLDEILNGGIPIGNIIEVIGLADSGKTQLCLQIAINCVQWSSGSVLYIDTKGDFSAIRIQKILDAQGLSHKEMAVIMHKIKVVHIWTMEQLIELLQYVKHKTIQFQDLAIIVVDSLPCLMFQFLGEENKIGLSLLNKFVNYSRFLCNDLDISVICVNIQTRWVDQEIIDLEDDLQQSVTLCKEKVFVEKQNRCLGNYWRNVPALLLLLEKSTANESSYEHNISITSVKSFNKEKRKCVLKLNASGIS